MYIQVAASCLLFCMVLYITSMFAIDCFLSELIKWRFTDACIPVAMPSGPVLMLPSPQLPHSLTAQ